MTEDGRPTTYTYNDWGRLTGKAQGSLAAAMTYAYGDKLKQSTSNFPGEAALVQYNYDGMGRRRNSLLNSTTLTWYRWNGAQQYADYAAGDDPNTVWDIGAVQRTYIPGLAEVLPSGSTSMATYQYHTLDHLGSPRGIWDASRNLLGARSFSPYGLPRVLAGLPLGTGFTGHHWDSSIQQYYALYRTYSPGAARWNMRDPVLLASGMSLYGYVWGRPLTLIDLLGLTPVNPEEGACFVTKAEEWIGTPYVYGGNSKKGIDCSHFVYNVFTDAGYGYDYVSTSAFPPAGDDFVEVKPEDAQSGDVMLHDGHMGFYNPKKPTNKCELSATNGGVGYGDPKWFKGRKFYRRNKPDGACGTK
jgi:RHS repeat-associated protein